MDKPTARDWQTLYAAAMAESENTHLSGSTDDAEVAILERLREVVGDCSVSEESELYAALRKLQRSESAASIRSVMRSGRTQSYLPATAASSASASCLDARLGSADAESSQQSSLGLGRLKQRCQLGTRRQL